MVEVRRVRAEEFEVLRDVRLTALADTPSAFGSTHAAEAARDLDFWRERAESNATGPFATYLARVDDEVVGLVGLIDGESADAGELVSMWVAGEHRGTGAADALVAAAVERAADRGFAAVELWVTEINDRAIAFYERCGFRRTGAVAPLPSDPTLDELRMRREIA